MAPDHSMPTGRERPQPIFNAPPGTMWITASLVVVHVVLWLVPVDWEFWVLERFAFVPSSFLQQFGSASGGFDGHEWVRLVSYAFLHGDLLHLVVNAGMLLAFGALVERAIGTIRFFVLFFACAVLAALAQAIATGAQPILVIGASGAGYGLIGAGVPYLYSGRVDRGPREAMLFVAAIMGLNLIFGLTGLGSLVTGAEIAWEAHIGGFIAGLALIFVLAPRR